MPYRDPTPDDPRDYVDEPMTEPTTFEPDWGDLTMALMHAMDEARFNDGKMIDIARAIVTEHHRQMAEAGYVEVKHTLLEKINEFIYVAASNGILTFWVDEEIGEFRAVIAAARQIENERT